MISARRVPEDRTVWIALAMLVAVRLLCLGAYPLMDNTEARYAEIARKMCELGDWVTPWFDYDTPYWGKPPLAFWLSAWSLQWFGINEFAARLPHLLCGVGVAWVVWDLGRWRSRGDANLALWLLVSSSLFFIAAGAVMTDMVLTLSLGLIMRGFWLALEEGRRRAGYGVFIGLAAGLLAKGPLVVLLGVMPLALWVIATGRMRDVWRALPWRTGLLVTVSLAGPWYLLAELRTPGFVEYFLIGEHWRRFAEPGWSGDRYGNAQTEPRGSIWLYGFLGTLPWSVLLPVATLRRQRLHRHVRPMDQQWRLYLLLWALVPFVLFTPARNIIWTYALPAIPALALLAAYWLSNLSDQDSLRRWVITGLITAPALFLSYQTHLVATGLVEKRSTKALVEDYTAQAVNGEQLFFFGKRPYSAAWYSHGRASSAPNLVALDQQVRHSLDFFAIKHDRLVELPEGLRQHLQPVGQRGDYGLYRSVALPAPPNKPPLNEAPDPGRTAAVSAK